MVDVADSKSVVLTDVRVQVPPGAPTYAVIYLSNKEISKYNDKNLFQKFKDLIINIADYSSTGYTIKTNEGFYWTNQINQMLELDSTEKINFSKENIIYQYIYMK